MAELLKRLRRVALALDGVKRGVRAGLRVALLFSKLITRALTLVLGSEFPVSSELDESFSACCMSPVDMADVMRRELGGGWSDFMEVELLSLLLLLLMPPGADLLAELIVGRMADGVRLIEPNDDDLETFDEELRIACTGVIPEALDRGRFSSPSESVDYK